MDRDEWATRRHRTHLCEHCGHLWTPHAFYTVGVEHTPRFSPSEVILMRRMGVTEEQFWTCAEAKPRAVLVGEAPGPSTWADCPLFPYPMASAGGRLMAMSDMDQVDYLRLFQRVNLLTAYPGASWSKGTKKTAREAANQIAHAARAKSWPLVLLGANVARAFGAGDLDSHTWYRLATVSPPGIPQASEVHVWRREVLGAQQSGVRAIRLPHPSGRNRDFNDPGARLRVQRALQEALQ